MSAEDQATNRTPTLWRAPRRWRDGPRAVTASFRLLPDFVIIGAQKAGTTSLFRYLSQHPEVLPSARKEVHYFDLQLDRGERWYRSQFPTRFERDRVRAREGRCLTGEASPYYLFHPLAPARARALVPEARLIALLREPVDRAFSHYHHEKRAGREPLEFGAAIERERAEFSAESERLIAQPERYSEFHHRHCYLHRGRYADQLEHWLESFPAEQLLILRSEDLFDHPAETFSRVLEFIGLSPWAPGVFEKHNIGRYDQIETNDRRGIEEFFREPNAQLRERFGSEFHWD